jgi:hypothetical protein
MTYVAAGEREAIEQRGGNMMKTWSERRMKNRVAGLPLHLFTPEAGLRDMMKHNGIRAKEAVAIKGGQEIFPSLTLLQARLAEKASENPDEREYQMALHSQLGQMSKSDFPIRTFVGCFCVGADGPVLWSRFGQTGAGYMLVFRHDFVMRDAPEHYQYLVGPVTYGDDQKLEQLDIIVDEGAYVRGALQRNFGHGITGDRLNLFTSYVASEVALHLVLMKPDVFRDEHEWRVAYAQLDETPLPVQPFETGEPYVRLRLTVKVPAEDERLPLKGVILGKYASQSEDWVFDLLVASGYSLPRSAVRRSRVEPNDPLAVPTQRTAGRRPCRPHRRLHPPQSASKVPLLG